MRLEIDPIYTGWDQEYEETYLYIECKTKPLKRKIRPVQKAPGTQSRGHRINSNGLIKIKGTQTPVGVNK